MSDTETAVTTFAEQSDLDRRMLERVLAIWPEVLAAGRWPEGSMRPARVVSEKYLLEVEAQPALYAGRHPSEDARRLAKELEKRTKGTLRRVTIESAPMAETISVAEALELLSHLPTESRLPVVLGRCVQLPASVEGTIGNLRAAAYERPKRATRLGQFERTRGGV